MGANHWLDPLREGERGPDAKGMYMWAALSAGPVWDIAHGRSHPVWLAVPAVLAAAAGYLVTVHLAFSDRRRAQLHALPLLAAVVLPSVIGFQGNWFYLQVMLAIAVGTAITTRWLPIVGLVLCGVTFAVRFATGGTVGESLVLVWSVATAALIPAMIIRLWEAIRELQRTREELAELAVAEERLRFARDLHDLLGHTLSGGEGGGGTAPGPARRPGGGTAGRGHRGDRPQGARRGARRRHRIPGGRVSPPSSRPPGRCSPTPASPPCSASRRYGSRRRPERCSAGRYGKA